MWKSDRREKRYFIDANSKSTRTLNAHFISRPTIKAHQAVNVEINDVLHPSSLLQEGHDHFRKCVSMRGVEIIAAVVITFLSPGQVVLL